MAEGEDQKQTSAADRSTEEAEEFLPGFTSLEDYSKVNVAIYVIFMPDHHRLVLPWIRDVNQIV